LPQVNSSTIRGLSLGGNALSGTLPYSYQAAPLLTFLDISGNRLTGPLAAAPPAAGGTPASGPWGAAMPALRWADEDEPLTCMYACVHVFLLICPGYPPSAVLPLLVVSLD
jgi:hypothetical protein